MNPSTFTHSTTPQSDKKKIRILSIDGGGMKGAIPATLLAYLESAIQRESGNSDARIADYFDFLAGTSTGGILVSSVLTPDPANPGRPRYTAEEARSLYFEKGPKIFAHTWLRRLRTLFGWIKVRYNAKQLESAVQDKIGGNTLLSDMLKPCMLTAYEISQRKAMFFTSANAGGNPHKNFLAWQVTCATSSAPTFFKPARIQGLDGSRYSLIDGGMFANNPAMCALTEVKKMDEFQIEGESPTIKDIVMVSLGTGKRKKKYGYKKMKKKGKVGWIEPIVDILMGGNAETVSHQLAKLYDEATQADSNDYYRIEPNLYNADTEMDNASKKNLKNLEEAGQKNLQTYRHTLDDIARKLVENHPVEKTKTATILEKTV